MKPKIARKWRNCKFVMEDERYVVVLDRVVYRGQYEIRFILKQRK